MNNPITTDRLMAASTFKTRERKENLVYLFANQKGGVGKSTLCIQFAHYQRINRKSVIVIDTDTQMSTIKIHDKSKKKHPGKEVPFEVYHYDFLGNRERMESLLEDVRSQTDDDFIIDTPGNLSRPGMVPLITGCNVIVCPFMYDEASAMATLDFVNAVKTICDKEGKPFPQFEFVPNRIQPRWGTKEEYKMWDAIDESLRAFGTITRRVMASPEVQRVDSIIYNRRQHELVSPAFDDICNNIGKKQITFT